MKHMQKELFSYWVTEFLTKELLINRNLSVNTQKSYRDSFVLFLRYLECSKQYTPLTFKINELSAELILNFLADLSEKRSVSPATCNQRLAALKSFARFTSRMFPDFLGHATSIQHIHPKKYTQSVIDYLTRDEMQGILSIPDKDTALGFRNYVLLMFMYNTGARASEVCNVKISDISFDVQTYVKLNGKGNRQRLCPLWKNTASLLQRYIQLTRTDDSELLFKGIRKNGITRHGIYEIIESCVQQAKMRIPSLGTKNITPHSLRHTTAVHLLLAGVDINSIRAWLGHTSVETTNIYATITLEMKSKAIEKCSITTSQSTAHWKNNGELLAFLKSI